MGSTVRTSRKQQRYGANYTDPATGKIRSSWTDYYNINIMTATADYAPFNDRNLYQNNAIQTRLSWLGKERDKESGLGDHGVRKYDNISGRFLSIDPLWEKYLSWTLYQYAGNNPVNAYDVDGRDILFAYRSPGTYSAFDPGHISMAVVVPDPNKITQKLDIKASWSFTPKDNSFSFDIISGTKSRQADIKSDIKDATELLYVNTNSKFDNILSGLIDSRSKENELYRITKNNCSITLMQLINSALAIYGSKTKLEEPIVPKRALDELKSQKSKIENLEIIDEVSK